MSEPKAILVDTDILIDYLRGSRGAIQYLEEVDAELKLSVINVAEVYSGVRDHERGAVKNLLDCFEIVPLDPALAERSGLLRREYGKSHGAGLGDAIIAATAEKLGCTLATLNRKHYPMLDSVVVPCERE